MNKKYLANLINANAFDDIDIKWWATLAPLNKCFYGCKSFRELLYLGKAGGPRTLNPTYLVHIQTTHGLPVINFIDMIASKLYTTKEARDKMLKLYSFLDK